MAFGAVEVAITNRYLSAHPKGDYLKITEGPPPAIETSGFQGLLSGRQFKPSQVWSQPLTEVQRADLSDGSWPKPAVRSQAELATLNSPC